MLLKVFLGSHFSFALATLAEGAVPADEFLQYVAIRHNNNDQRFIEEFEVRDVIIDSLFLSA